MVLVHTEEELFATEEPAICVIGATSYESEDCYGKPMKVYVRVVRINKAFTDEEDRLVENALADPTIRGEQMIKYENFLDERGRLVFGSEEYDVIGDYDGMTVLAHKKYI